MRWKEDEAGLEDRLQRSARPDPTWSVPGEALAETRDPEKQRKAKALGTVRIDYGG